jgi:hypothetical protein
MNFFTHHAKAFAGPGCSIRRVASSTAADGTSCSGGTLLFPAAAPNAAAGSTGASSCGCTRDGLTLADYGIGREATLVDMSLPGLGGGPKASKGLGKPTSNQAKIVQIFSPSLKVGLAAAGTTSRSGR